MVSLEEVQKANRELAERINAEALANPQSEYAGKYVGIANGKIVIVTEDIEEMDDVLETADPDPRRVFWVEASRDPDEVQYIWSSR